MAMRCLLLLAAFLVAGSWKHHGEARPLVPSVMLFGDSLVDIGNNDYILTVAKANFPPYGRDFEDHIATGRFCNGKLLSDFIAETVGFTSSPVAYLSPEASGEYLLSGANFASAQSGYYDQTAHIYNVIPLSQQLEHFKEYQHKLAVLAGSSQAQSIMSDSLYIISAGTNDYLFNYYINPFNYNSPDQFSDLLIEIFNNTVAVRNIKDAILGHVIMITRFANLEPTVGTLRHGSSAHRCFLFAKFWLCTLNNHGVWPWRQWHMRNEAQQRRPEVQQKVRRIRRLDVEAVPRSQDCGSRFVQTFAQPRHLSWLTRVHRVKARMLWDRDGGGYGISLQSHIDRDLSKCNNIRVLGFDPPHRSGKQSDRGFPRRWHQPACYVNHIAGTSHAARGKGQSHCPSLPNTDCPLDSTHLPLKVLLVSSH